MSTRPMTAVTMIAPNTRLGVYRNNGIKNRSVTITVTAMMMLETAVLAPALWFTADRENAPVTMIRWLLEHIRDSNGHVGFGCVIYKISKLLLGQNGV
ncbi:hypothetical protein Hdeb2414_s0290g00858711 [Helianthus debilis subsp. tardiflorus]